MVKAAARKARPARLPTTMPMIVPVERELDEDGEEDEEGLDVLSDPVPLVVAVGAAVLDVVRKPVVAVGEPPAGVVVAGTLAGMTVA